MSDIVSERNILGISPTVADPNTNIHDQAAALSNDFEVTEGADNQEPTLWMVSVFSRSSDLSDRKKHHNAIDLGAELQLLAFRRST